jgi:hypothetical protein
MVTGDIKSRLKSIQAFLIRIWLVTTKTTKSLFLFLDSSNVITSRFVSIFTGFIFGLSVAVGLGLNPIGAILFGAITGTGVFITRSLIGYLVIQTITLSLVAFIFIGLYRAIPFLSLVVFGTIPTLSLDAGLFQMSYTALIATSPLVFLIPRIKNALSSLETPSSVQLTVSILFASLVAFLRSRMPNDASFAFSQLYFGEDNAGVVEVLVDSMKSGYASHVSKFGEFINGAYLAAAGNITWFGDMGELGLLPALTHYNMTLLFMAWLPIAALSALVFSGKKFTPPITIAVISVMTAVSALLFWPFVPLGHTSVISAGLFAMSLLALTLNRKLALEHPLLFISLITSLGLIVGNIWFPMMPFAVATVALAFLALLQVEYQKGNKKIVIALVSLFAGLGLLLLPEALWLALNNSDFLAMTGGTRSSGRFFTVIWALFTLVVLWRMVQSRKNRGFIGTNLFLAVVLLLLCSIVFLLLAGFLNNPGHVGYGAKKYLITSIAFTIPVFWMLLANLSVEKIMNRVMASGLVALLATFVFLPDSRQVLDSITFQSHGGFLKTVTEEDLDYANSGVFAAMETALAREPDHIFCVSDYGYPVPGDEQSLDSYFCSRWGQSFTSDESVAWRFVPLDRMPVSSLNEVRESIHNEKVVVIRLQRVSDQLSVSDASKTWWAKYVDDSWLIIDLPQ